MICLVLGLFSLLDWRINETEESVWVYMKIKIADIWRKVDVKHDYFTTTKLNIFVMLQNILKLY